MHQIKCPNCGQVFTIDESGYADIVRQVRDDAFEKAVRERLNLAEEEKRTAVELAEVKVEAQLKEELSKRAAEVAQLKGELERAQLAQELAVKEALTEVEMEKIRLSEALTAKEFENKLNEAALKDKYEDQIRDRNETIERLKDLKAKLSTKMVGETLEQHCEIEFNKLRATAFRDAYFEKDNDASSGSKGDYIYRESDPSGAEFISIMFEMKNEEDETKTKKKNEDFFKELDRDRNEKKCEYAVLVSLLEPDNDWYNGGIVDVSHLYPKMYVVRPQFFIPIITVLRNAALNSLAFQ